MIRNFVIRNSMHQEFGTLGTLLLRNFVTQELCYSGTLLLRNFVIGNFVISNFVIRNFVIRNFVPVPFHVLHYRRWHLNSIRKIGGGILNISCVLIFSCVTTPSLLFSIFTPATISNQNTYREFGQDYKQELRAESKNKITPAETHHNITLEQFRDEIQSSVMK